MRATRPDPSVALIAGLAGALPALALTGLFVWMAFFIRGHGGRWVDWGAPALFAFVCGVSAVVTIGRTFVKARAAALRAGPQVDASPMPMPAEPSFDAEAAIQRYLAARDPVGPAAGPAPPTAPIPPRPPFGRKRS